MLLDEPAKPLLDDMGVNLCRRDIGMAEKLLHRAQISAPLEQMAGKGMAEHVRGDARGLDPDLKGERLQLLAEALARQMLAA